MQNWKSENTAQKLLSVCLALASLTAMSLAAIGCGSGPDVPVITVADGGSAGGGSFGGDTTIDPGLTPNYDWRIKVTGSGRAVPIDGGSLRLQTDTTLKIRLKAGDGLRLSGTGYTVGFNCQKFYVTVGNMSKPVFVKRESYTSVPRQMGWMSYDPCEGAPTTWAGDFSGALAPGHGDITVRIDSAQYDNCRLHNYPGFYGVYYGGCGISSLYQTHSMDAQVEAFTN